MRAIVYRGTGGPEVIAATDVPDAVAGSGDALVEIAFAGLNRADLLERAGRYWQPPAAASIPGLEFSGTVRSVGAGVRTLAVGDRVCGLVPAGAHAQLVATHELTLARVPSGVSLRDAAAIPESFITAHDALVTRAGFALGDRVVVHAVGSSVGLAAIALIDRGGGSALGTSRTPAKLERARALGLAYGFTLDDEWVRRVTEATGGRGADIILDFIGAPIMNANLDALAPGGRIVQIGTLGGAEGALSLATLMRKRASIHGTVLRTRALDERIALAKHLERALLPLFERGDLAVEVDRTFTLAQMRAAHEYMESNRNFGKIVIAL